MRLHPLGLLVLVGIATAQLPPNTCPPGSGKNFFRCASNGFNGCCSVDACSLPAGQCCPDYYPWTYNPKNEGSTPSPNPIVPSPTPGTCAKGTGSFFICASNGFKGCCKVDACNVPNNGWCPDYEPWTYTPKKNPTPGQPTECPAGKYFYKCQSTGFNGCCSKDACQKPGEWCPDYKPWTYDVITPVLPPVEKWPVSCPAGKYPTCGSATLPPGTCAAGSGQSYYDCQSNKFKGCCSQDACNMNTGPWCPDYKPWTYDPSGTYKCPDGSYPTCKAIDAVTNYPSAITHPVPPTYPPYTPIHTPTYSYTPPTSSYSPPPYVKPAAPADGSCPKACLVHYNSCDKTTAPTCIFPDPYVSNPRGACACRPGYKASYVTDGDTSKHWRLPVVGQEHRVWVAEGVPCDMLCKNPWGVDSCREVKELGKECIG